MFSDLFLFKHSTPISFFLNIAQRYCSRFPPSRPGFDSRRSQKVIRRKARLFRINKWRLDNVDRIHLVLASDKVALACFAPVNVKVNTSDRKKIY